MPEHSPSPSPERAIYGFVLYLIAYVIFGMYVIWAFVPISYLNMVGLTYWPQKYWAIAFPTYLCVTFLLSYVCYMGLVCLRTTSMDSVHSITDQCALPPSEKTLPKEAIAPIADLSISEVNRHLYLERR